LLCVVNAVYDQRYVNDKGAIHKNCLLKTSSSSSEITLSLLQKYLFGYKVLWHKCRLILFRFMKIITLP